MQAYVTNKLMSFAGVFLCIFLTLLLFGYTTTQWQAILLAIMIFGYAHFFLGFYYQLKSFFRGQEPWQQVATFLFLVVFSVAVAYVLLEYIGFLTTLFVGFLYFLLHGLFNEQTLILRQTSIKVPLAFLFSLAIFVMTLLTYSVPDQTFFFDNRLQFVSVNSVQIEGVFERQYFSLENFPTIFYWGVVVSLLILAVSWWRYGFGRLTAFLTTTFLTITGLVIWLGAPAYIYMYLFVVGYHYLTWHLFYLKEMKQRGIVVYCKFIVHNVFVFVPLLYAAYLFFQPQTPELVYVVLNYEYFVVMTYVHISTSFMNDDWFKAAQTKMFSLLGR